MFGRGVGLSGKLLAVSVVFMLLLVVAGCGTLPSLDSWGFVSHPVWMSDGWVYYLRQVDSEPPEVWRQRADQQEGGRVLRTEDIEGPCGFATFLFRATGDDLGIATACTADNTRRDVARTELMMYSLQRMTFNHIASTPFLGGVAFDARTAIGYGQLRTGCGVAIKPIRDGVVGEFTKPITVAGKSWLLSGAEQPDCGSVAWSRSPVLAPAGGVFFLTAPDSIGQLPIIDSDLSGELKWYLCSWDGHSAAPRVITTLRGLDDLAVSPDGRFIIATIGTEGAGGIVMVDVTTGKTKKIAKGKKARQPNFSPDGNRLVYVENLRHLRVAPLDATP